MGEQVLPNCRQQAILGLTRIHEQLVELIDLAERENDSDVRTALHRVNLRVVISNSELSRS